MQSLHSNSRAMLPQALLRWVIVAVLVVPTALLLALGPRGADAPPAGRVVVDFWANWTGREADAVQLIVDDFNNSVGREKGIYVRCLSMSNIQQKTLISAAAGVPPDITALAEFDIPQFAARGALMPLDDLAARHGITDATYKKVFWDECHYGGHLYALIACGADYALFINTAKFRAAGLDPAKPPQTIAELDADAEKMTVIDGGRIQVAGYLPTEPGWIINDTPIWFGGFWWDSTHARFTFTDPHVVQAFTWVQSYSKRLGADTIARFSSGQGNFDSPQNPFFVQSLAMEQQGTFFVPFIQTRGQALGGNWSAAAFPSYSAGFKDVTYCTADMLAIPSGARHPEQAFEFLAYMTRQDVMEKLSSLHGKISPLAQVSDSFLNHHGNPYIRVFERLAASPNARGAPSVPIMGEVTDEMSNFIDRLKSLKVSPEKGLEQLQSRLQAKLDEFEQEQKLRGDLQW